MTAAKAPRAARKPRIRKPGKDIVPKPPADLVPRSPFTGWGAVDGLVWRARRAVELPVFWNPAGLDAADAERRATEEAACAALDASYDLNHYRALPDWGAFPGEDERWQSYRASTGTVEVSHEPEPPAHPEPHPSGPLPAGDWAIGVTGQLPANFDEHLARFLAGHARQDGGFSEPDEEGTSWRVTPDVPGAEGPPDSAPGTPDKPHEPAPGEAGE